MAADKVDDSHHQPERSANNSDLKAIYAQPHKLIPKDSASLSTDAQNNRPAVLDIVQE